MNLCKPVSLALLLVTLYSCGNNNTPKAEEKGVQEAAIKDTAEAIRALEKAFTAKPSQATGIELANLYAETGDKRAIDLCDAMLKADSVHMLIDAVFIKGIYYAKTGDEKQALAQFDECIKIDWKFTEAYMEKGILLYDSRRLQEAFKIFQLAATVTNTYADAYFWMGRCQEALGLKKEAAENYSKAIALDKDFTEAEQALKRINIL